MAGSIDTLGPDVSGQTNYCLSFEELEAWGTEKGRGGFCAEGFLCLRSLCDVCWKTVNVGVPFQPCE